VFPVDLDGISALNDHFHVVESLHVFQVGLPIEPVLLGLLGKNVFQLFLQ